MNNIHTFLILIFRVATIIASDPDKDSSSTSAYIDDGIRINGMDIFQIIEELEKSGIQNEGGTTRKRSLDNIMMSNTDLNAENLHASLSESNAKRAHIVKPTNLDVQIRYPISEPIPSNKYVIRIPGTTETKPRSIALHTRSLMPNARLHNKVDAKLSQEPTPRNTSQTPRDRPDSMLILNGPEATNRLPVNELEVLIGEHISIINDGNVNVNNYFNKIQILNKMITSFNDAYTNSLPEFHKKTVENMYNVLAQKQKFNDFMQDHSTLNVQISKHKSYYRIQKLKYILENITPSQLYHINVEVESIVMIDLIYAEYISHVTNAPVQIVREYMKLKFSCIQDRITYLVKSDLMEIERFKNGKQFTLPKSFNLSLNVLTNFNLINLHAKFSLDINQYNKYKIMVNKKFQMKYNKWKTLEHIFTPYSNINQIFVDRIEFMRQYSTKQINIYIKNVTFADKAVVRNSLKNGVYDFENMKLMGLSASKNQLEGYLKKLAHQHTIDLLNDISIPNLYKLSKQTKLINSNTQNITKIIFDKTSIHGKKISQYLKYVEYANHIPFSHFSKNELELLTKLNVTDSDELLELSENLMSPIQNIKQFKDKINTMLSMKYNRRHRQRILGEERMYTYIEGCAPHTPAKHNTRRMIYGCKSKNGPRRIFERRNIRNSFKDENLKMPKYEVKIVHNKPMKHIYVHNNQRRNVMKNTLAKLGIVLGVATYTALGTFVLNSMHDKAIEEPEIFVGDIYNDISPF